MQRLRSLFQKYATEMQVPIDFAQLALATKCAAIVGIPIFSIDLNCFRGCKLACEGSVYLSDGIRHGIGTVGDGDGGGVCG